MHVDPGTRIRARCANPAEIVDDRPQCRNTFSSPTRNTNGSTRDVIHRLNHGPESHIGHATLERNPLTPLYVRRLKTTQYSTRHCINYNKSIH